MNCPHCNEEGFDFGTNIGRAMYIADVYRSTKLVTTDCCKKLVLVRPVRSYEFSVYNGPIKQDDWGVTAKT